MADPKARIRRLIALAIAAQKSGDAKRARRLLEAAIKHNKDASTPVTQQQQPQAKKKD
jgi:hypothetical protein